MKCINVASVLFVIVVNQPQQILAKEVWVCGGTITKLTNIDCQSFPHEPDTHEGCYFKADRYLSCTGLCQRVEVGTQPEEICDIYCNGFLEKNCNKTVEMQKPLTTGKPAVTMTQAKTTTTKSLSTTTKDSTKSKIEKRNQTAGIAAASLLAAILILIVAADRVSHCRRQKCLVCCCCEPGQCFFIEAFRKLKQKTEACLRPRREQAVDIEPTERQISATNPVSQGQQESQLDPDTSYPFQEGQPLFVRKPEECTEPSNRAPEIEPTGEQESGDELTRTNCTRTVDPTVTYV